MDDERLIRDAQEQVRRLPGQAGARPGVDPERQARSGATRILIQGYEILSEIHRGGQGVVYLAIQRSTNRKVAVKVVRDGPFRSHSEQIRFQREVETLARLRHPNIVAIHDSGSVVGCQYFVMEYVDGTSLDEHVRSVRSQDGTDPKVFIRETVRMFCKICDAVQCAHLHGIIHRDLKPSNIRVDTKGEPYVLDFGLAVSGGEGRADATDGLTRTGEFVGTMWYASPEQLSGRSHDLDLRSDVFSLGVILFEMLTGRLPVDVSGTPHDVVRRILEDELIRPSRLCQAIGDELDTIILKCLARDPDRRYVTAGNVGEDLRRFLAGEPIEAKRDSTWYVLQKRMARYRAALLAVSAFLALAICSGIGLGLANRRANDATEQALAAKKQTQLRSDELRHINYDNTIALAQHAWQTGDAQRLGQLLNECPSGLRGWEWRFLRSVSDTSLVTVHGDGNKVYAVAASPDGTLLAGAHHAGLITVWSIPEWKRVHWLSGHSPRTTWSLSFTPDGRTLVSGGSDHAIRIWDLETGKQQRELRGHSGRVKAVACAPDGTTLASGSRDKTIQLWDLSTGAQLRTIDVGSVVDALAWSPKGDSFASANWDGTVRLWSAEGHPVRVFRGHQGRVESVAFAPDGRRIVSGAVDSTIRVWDATSGHQLEKINLGMGIAHGVAVSPDGSLIVAGVDLTVQAFDLDDGRHVWTKLGHLDATTDVVFILDGRSVASASTDGTVRAWSPGSAAHPLLIGRSHNHVRDVVISPDQSRIVSGERSGMIRVHSPTGKEQMTIASAHPGGVEAVASDPHGQWIVSGGWDGKVRIWDSNTGASIRELAAHTGIVLDVAVSPDCSTIASAGDDGLVCLWNAWTGELKHRFESGSAVHAVAFSPDGRQIASCGEDGVVRTRTTRDGQLVLTALGHSDAVIDVVYSPDGLQIASGGKDRTVRLWDAATGHLLRTLRGHREHVQGLAFSPDGARLISSGYDGFINVWDLSTGRLLLNLQAHSGGILGLAMAPSGDWFVSGSNDGTIKVWGAVTPANLPTAPASRGAIQDGVSD